MSMPAAYPSCRQARRRFSALQDNELPREQAASLSAHLDDCPTCRAEFRRLEAAWTALGESPAPPAPPDFPGQVLERRDSIPRRWGVLPSGTRPLRGFAASAAALAFTLLSGLAAGSLVGRAVLPGQEAFPPAESASTLASLDAFAAAPRGSLAHGYLQLAGREGR